MSEEHGTEEARIGSCELFNLSSFILEIIIQNLNANKFLLSFKEALQIREDDMIDRSMTSSS